MPRQLLRLCGLVSLAAVISCLEPTTIVCADGRLCPQGTICDVVGASCVQPGGLSIRDSVIDLGTIECGTSTIAAVSLSNFGDEAISFSVSSTLDFISVSPEVGVVTPGERLDVELTADATSLPLPVGVVEGAIYFTTSAEVMPRIVTATIAGANVTTNVQAIDFGIASLDSPPEPRAVEIRNDGNVATEVSISAPEAPFSIVSTAPIPIEPDAIAMVPISFSPQFTGAYASALEIDVAGAVCQEPPNGVELSGQISDAGMLVDTTIVDYGTSSCGVPSMSVGVSFRSNLADPQALSLEVTGTDAVAYEVKPTATLMPGAETVIDFSRLAIGATTLGQKAAKVKVAALPAGESIEISLQHQIVAPLLSATPTNVSFPGMAPQSSASQQFTVANLGNAPAAVSIRPDVVIFPDGGKLSVVPADFTLGSNQTRTVDLKVEVVKGRFAETFELTVSADGQCDEPLPIGVNIRANDG